MARSGALPRGGGPDASADDLVRARAALLGGTPRQRQLAAPALRAALADLYELWLSSRCAAVGIGRGSALVAVGALGRRELVPYSDLDLVLLHDGKGNVAQLADSLWYPLWDARVDLDHSVRTVGQAMQVAATDLRAALGLLDARLIAGDEDLFTAMAGAVRRAWTVSDGRACCIRHAVEDSDLDDMSQHDLFVIIYEALRQLGHADPY